MNMKPLRGKILAFLHYMAPKPVDTLGIAGVYIDYYTLDEIEKALAYLVSKLYVQVDEKPHPYKARVMVRLYTIMATGIDVQEGTTRDLGVMVGAY